MAAKELVLVTGANGGIGFELVAQLAAKGYRVLLGSRSTEKGNAALKDLQSRNLPGPINMIQIDYQDDETIKAAASAVEKDYGYLDILVNNAALGGLGMSDIRDTFRQVLDTNVAGPALTAEAFTPLLKKSRSPLKRVVNVSSGAGSIASRLDKNSPTYTQGDIRMLPYRASKAAANMVTANLHAVLEPDGIKVLCYCPGFTISNLSHMNKAENGAHSTADGVRPLVDIIEGKKDEEEGLFKNNTGGVYPW